ncbi:uncharacterized protein LTR77_004205 [Saxophila tyrrhenica]|uniref:Uncharacterized protein n=1 Tax=Saxophila tyrrhenica TaxID=1690608 RepID=A0AAV9PCH9_9PEZI|nr:hypothetical protein LTR77_004205 [Saxophila tyrrhenica]
MKNLSRNSREHSRLQQSYSHTVSVTFGVDMQARNLLSETPYPETVKEVHKQRFWKLAYRIQYFIEAARNKYPQDKGIEGRHGLGEGEDFYGNGDWELQAQKAYERKLEEPKIAEEEQIDAEEELDEDGESDSEGEPDA